MVRVEMINAAQAPHGYHVPVLRQGGQYYLDADTAQALIASKAARACEEAKRG